jgi:hypothetical protein
MLRSFSLWTAVHTAPPSFNCSCTPAPYSKLYESVTTPNAQARAHARDLHRQPVQRVPNSTIHPLR